MNRLDLFISEREVARVCQAIREAGAPGYSVMRHVTGMGVGGAIDEEMDFSGLGANAHVIVFCTPEQLVVVRQRLGPVLRRYGGVGFVSQAEAL